MYAKYQTDALVLGTNARGEADKLITLYTHDFGLVRARASAVRSEKSRMRYALQLFSRSQVALVRGARGWRVTGSLAGSLIPTTAREGLSAFARIAQLLERLVSGEEQNTVLFSIVSDAHRALSSASAEKQPIIELVCVARILHNLGYLSTEALGSALFAQTSYSDEYLHEAEHVRTPLLTSVNRALSETQL